ncbi:hypothetical protein C2E23DRAFT_887223 [Lenzites betulinus]|nr:hypothetical protein C2E23DRAFT_887223 [Lenzites betulinus]
MSVKQAAQADYLSSARTLASVKEALMNHEPESLLNDPRNLPELVRHNFGAIDTLEEMNQDVREQIAQTQDRIDFLEHTGV